MRPAIRSGEFVAVAEGQFTLAGERFRVAGANAYYLLEEAAREFKQGKRSSAVVDQVMSKLAALGGTVLRTWAFHDKPDNDVALQREPGKLDEIGIRALDHIIARAEHYGLRLILPLVNYWSAYGGIDQYLRWNGLACGETEHRGAFFVEPKLKQHFRRHIEALLAHVNIETGRRYADEPAVFSWELVNEAAGHGTGANALAEWYGEMAAALRHGGARQLVGSGEIGYDDVCDHPDADTINELADDWLLDGSQETSFSRNTEQVDYASIHTYPESWVKRAEHTRPLVAAWTNLHARIAAERGRPLLVGEFGLKNREHVATALHSMAERQVLYREWLAFAESGAIAGALPWLLINDGRDTRWDEFSFGLRDQTPTLDVHNQYTAIVCEHMRAMEQAVFTSVAHHAVRPRRRSFWQSVGEFFGWA